MKPDRLKIGTRGSALALWQTNHVAGLLQQAHPALDLDIVQIKTKGDQITDVPLWEVDGKGFFTKELDDALLEGRVDIVVHSLKDLATDPVDGIAIGAILTREDPRDVLICKESHTFETLPSGARVGTSSLRRRAFIQRLRPDLTLRHLRGNVPTRIDKLDTGEMDAIVLAAAGVKRLGLGDRISDYLDSTVFPPAPGQGSVAVTHRMSDARAADYVATLNDAEAAATTNAERAVLAELNGGCHTPLGTFAQLVASGSGPKQIHLSAILSSPDGDRSATAEATMPADAPEKLGQDVARRLLDEFGPIDNAALASAKAGHE